MSDKVLIPAALARHSYRQAEAVPWEAAPPTRAVSATHDVSGQGGEPFPAPPLVHKALPLLTSACPGWVCYAEKTTPAALPYIATTKSPQQVGSIAFVPREGMLWMAVTAD